MEDVVNTSLYEPPVDIEKLTILYQRRYNIFRDIKSATDDLSMALSRNDSVSAELILEIRGDYFEKCDRNWQEISLMAEENADSADYMKRVAFAPIEEVTPSGKQEERLLEIRKKIDIILKDLKERDRMINIRTAKEKSYYSNE